MGLRGAWGVGAVLALALSACEAPVALHQEEVPPRLHRFGPQGVEVLPAEGPPLRLTVALHRRGQEVQAVLRSEGVRAEGVVLLLLEGNGVRLEESGTGGFLQVRGAVPPPACAHWTLALSPDDPEEETMEVRFYQAQGMLCEEER
ncbi:MULTISPECIES: hypothetical protein [Thermus]|uniref:hypothetical protein n=1 Tax=Thermus thalpophilus TaxID=2908147 RepID=UPI001FAAD25B